MKQGESKLQIQCIRWFDLQYPNLKQLLFAIPNGGNRNIITAKIMKAEGVRAGVSDLFLSVASQGFNGLYIEMKYGKNKATPEQRTFIEAVRAHGYKAEIIDSFDKFQDQIQNYLI